MKVRTFIIGGDAQDMIVKPARGRGLRACNPLPVANPRPPLLGVGGRGAGRRACKAARPASVPPAHPSTLRIGAAEGWPRSVARPSRSPTLAVSGPCDPAGQEKGRTSSSQNGTKAGILLGDVGLSAWDAFLDRSNIVEVSAELPGFMMVFTTTRERT